MFWTSTISPFLFCRVNFFTSLQACPFSLSKVPKTLAETFFKVEDIVSRKMLLLGGVVFSNAGYLFFLFVFTTIQQLTSELILNKSSNCLFSFNNCSCHCVWFQIKSHKKWAWKGSKCTIEPRSLGRNSPSLGERHTWLRHCLSCVCLFCTSLFFVAWDTSPLLALWKERWDSRLTGFGFQNT